MINESHIKRITYEKEDRFLSQYAKKSAETVGRRREEEPCPMRTEFQRDRDRIIHSKSFRRLKNKTQVFLSPEGDHYRTRLTHTLDVSQIARSIARTLSLNEDLTEAIALGHDLGHTPFGHSGERTLRKLSNKSFNHAEQSLRVVDVLENEGEGLNLTGEVRDGILNHGTESHPSTLEGQVVRLADKIAYVNHDIDDAVRARLISIDDLPKKYIKLLGERSSQRINSMIASIYRNSADRDSVSMEDDVYEATYGLRAFLSERVYKSAAAVELEYRCDRMLGELYGFLVKNPNDIPILNRAIAGEGNEKLAAIDYISSMTDRYAIHEFEKYFVPTCWKLEE